MRRPKTAEDTAAEQPSEPTGKHSASMGFSNLIWTKPGPGLVNTAILTEPCPHCKAEPVELCNPDFIPPETLKRLRRMQEGGLIMVHVSRICSAIKARNISPSMIIEKFGDITPSERESSAQQDRKTAIRTRVLAQCKHPFGKGRSQITMCRNCPRRK